MEPKYQVGDFVYQGKVCDRNIVRISNVYPPTDTMKTPRYAISYTQNRVRRDTNEIGTAGGGSTSWSEDELIPITDPHLLLIIRKFMINYAIRSCEQHLKSFKENLSKVDYALDVINPQPIKNENMEE